MIFESLKQKPRTVILDTDIGPDCDDVGALATLISYSKELKFPIAGICNCTSSIFGSAALDALCDYCGCGEILLGAYSKKGFLDEEKHQKYNRYLAERFSKKYQNGTLNPMPHVAFYRKLLSEAADGGVIVITIGMFNCLSDLLNSSADAYSPLSGRELMAKKIYAIVSMAAKLDEGREFNVVCDYQAAQNVFESCPVPMLLSDFNLGHSIHTGFSPDAEEAQENNPIFKSYQLYTKDNPNKENHRNPSYDLTAVQFACEGKGEIYGLTAAGRLEFFRYRPEKYPLADATRFMKDAKGNIRFMTKKVSDEKIAALLEERIYEFNL